MTMPPLFPPPTGSARPPRERLLWPWILFGATVLALCGYAAVISAAVDSAIRSSTETPAAVAPPRGEPHTHSGGADPTVACHTATQNHYLRSHLECRPEYCRLLRRAVRSREGAGCSRAVDEDRGEQFGGDRLGAQCADQRHVDHLPDHRGRGGGGRTDRHGQVCGGQLLRALMFARIALRPRGCSMSVSR